MLLLTFRKDKINVFGSRQIKSKWNENEKYEEKVKFHEMRLETDSSLPIVNNDL